MPLTDRGYKVPGDRTECGDLRAAGNYTFWRCYEEPRLLHKANIDTETGRYGLGNIFKEPLIHARNNFYDFASVYGDLVGEGPFGFRFSGHHLDINYGFKADGSVDDLPVFLGHNPLVVPGTTPPVVRSHDDEPIVDDRGHEYLSWRSFAGLSMFPRMVHLVFGAAKPLNNQSFIPLHMWDSVPWVGGLELKGGKNIKDYPHLDMSTMEEEDFGEVWELIAYTLRFSRGHRGTESEKDLLRAQGRVVWTSDHGATRIPEEDMPSSEADLLEENFYYVRAETDEWLFFVMINQLFTVVAETETTSHLHSILVKKSMVTCDTACCPPSGSDHPDPICAGPDHH